VFPRSWDGFAPFDQLSEAIVVLVICVNTDEPAKPATLQDSIAAFDAHLAASRDLFTMWVKDIPSRVFGALPKNFAMPPMQPPSAMAGAWFVPVSWELPDGRVRILLSTKDFGVHNWLDARGYRSGVVTWRASTPDQPATPTVTAIRADQIDEYFNPVQRVSDQDRAATVLARLRHFAEQNIP
jgi:hypothetical protein